MVRVASSLLGCWLGFSQGIADITEDFNGGWIDAAYAGISTYDHPGVGRWESQDALVSSDKPRSGDYVRLRNADAPYLEFKGLDGNGVDGGVGTVSFWFRHWDGDGSTIPFVLEYNQANFGWVQAGGGAASGTEYELFSSVLNLSGDDIRLRIRPTATPERLLIDDFSVVAAGAGPLMGFSEATSAAVEDVGVVEIPVTLSIPSNATVGISVVGGSALLPEDFELLTPSLQFSETQSTQSVRIALADDLVPEAEETIELTLVGPVGADLGQATHQLTILDDDPVGESGITLVVASANTSIGNFQLYEAAGDRILQALDVDIVGIQEFSVPDAGARHCPRAIVIGRAMSHRSFSEAAISRRLRSSRSFGHRAADGFSPPRNTEANSFILFRARPKCIWICGSELLPGFFLPADYRSIAQPTTPSPTAIVRRLLFNPFGQISTHIECSVVTTGAREFAYVCQEYLVD